LLNKSNNSMDEEKEKKEIDKKAEQEPAKSIDELIEPVERISDEVFATKEGGILMKALYKEQCVKNRQLEKEKLAVEDQNKGLEKTVAVYEERMSWKSSVSIIYSIIVGIGLLLIQFGIQSQLMYLNWIGMILIVLGILINFLPIKLRKKNKESKI